MSESEGPVLEQEIDDVVNRFTNGNFSHDAGESTWSLDDLDILVVAPSENEPDEMEVRFERLFDLYQDEAQVAIDLGEALHEATGVTVFVNALRSVGSQNGTWDQPYPIRRFPRWER